MAVGLALPLQARPVSRRARRRPVRSRRTSNARSDPHRGCQVDHDLGRLKKGRQSPKTHRALRDQDLVHAVLGERTPAPCPPAPIAGLLLNRAVRDLDWGELEWLIVDLPPGTADVQQHLVLELGLSGALLVVTPQDLAHLDAERFFAMLGRPRSPSLAGSRTWRRSRAHPAARPWSCSLRPRTIVLSGRAPGVCRLASIPFTVGLARAASEGSPLVDAEGGQGFHELSDAVIDAVPPTPG